MFERFFFESANKNGPQPNITTKHNKTQQTQTNKTFEMEWKKKVFQTFQMRGMNLRGDAMKAIVQELGEQPDPLAALQQLLTFLQVNIFLPFLFPLSLSRSLSLSLSSNSPLPHITFIPPPSSFFSSSSRTMEPTLPLSLSKEHKNNSKGSEPLKM